MRHFVREYRLGRPVLAVLPTGGRSIVMGFCFFEDGVGWCDDSLLNVPNPHSPYHQLYGMIRSEGQSVMCERVIFSPIYDGDQEASRAWNEAISIVTDMMATHDVTEHEIRVARLMASSAEA